PPGGAPGGGAAGARSGFPSAGDLAGVKPLNGGQGSKGLRQALGCEDPDTYKLSPEERAACLERFGQRARTAPDLGLPVPTGKQASFDHYVACRKAYTQKGGSIPSASAKVSGAAVAGLDPGPSLRECGPGER